MPSNNIAKRTLLTHSGRKGKSAVGPVNSPVVRASTILFPDMDELRAARGTRTDYGRLATETTRSLEVALCELEGAAGCMLTPSGLSAITTTLLALLSPGDHLLVTDSVYEPVRTFCNNVLKRMGVVVEFYDPLLGGEIAGLLKPTTRVVFVESPGSLTFEMQDIPAIAAVAQAHGALVVADSTWATPLGWDVFSLGVDVSIHAGTKYIVGHSDVTLGAILCNERTNATLRRFHWECGITVGSDDAYLALRGLRTLAARLAIHAANSKVVAEWLLAQPEVAALLYPPLPSSAGHALWRRDFHPQYACGLMGVQFNADISEEQADVLTNSTRLFGIGYSWGGYESLILPVAPGKLRAVTADRWKDKAIIRLHIGLEDPADLIQDLDQAFAEMRRR